MTLILPDLKTKVYNQDKTGQNILTKHKSLFKMLLNLMLIMFYRFSLGHIRKVF